MKIAYVAKHGSGGNDDEGAIAHALTELGHDVVCIPEHRGRDAKAERPDVVLFHKWHDPGALKALEGHCPRVFWYFDLVDYPDPTLKGRNATRIRWMNEVMELTDLGFCTDGDWVRQNPHKLVWLTQGADGRVAGREEGLKQDVQILFTGITRGGRGREEFVADVKARYGSRLHHVTSGVYRERLRELTARARVVVCPDHPTTDHYWSNRVYNAAGFGGCVIHPYCEGLTKHYPTALLPYYHDRDDLYRTIDVCLNQPTFARQIGERLLRHTVENHLYLHRCAELVDVIRKRLRV